MPDLFAAPGTPIMTGSQASSSKRASPPSTPWASCIAPGYTTYICDCGDSYQYLHSYDRPATDSNKDAQDYEVYTDTTKSYLVQNPDGTFTRVQHGEGPSHPELYVNDRVFIEQYDRDLNFLSHAQIPLELPLFGGYYTDGNFHFLVFGDFNLDASDEKEVFRVVKYSLDWKRLGCDPGTEKYLTMSRIQTSCMAGQAPCDGQQAVHPYP